MHSKTKSKEKMKVRHTSGFQRYFRLNLSRNLTRYTRGEILCRNTTGFRAEKPTSAFEVPTGSGKLTFMFLDITVLREKLKKEQMERERYENEANHQSRKVKISRVIA